MNGGVWLPGLLVLGVGLAIGLAAATSVRRGRRRQRRGRELQLRDLEGRRDELYRRLRSGELSDGDRESLELAAARTLRELERLDPASARAPAAAAATVAKPPSEPAQGPAGSRHPALVGFVAGMAVVLLVGTLVYLAVRDSGAARAPAAAAPSEPHPGSGAVPAEVQQELGRLEQMVAAAPDDLLARKRLALGRLGAGLYFEAFNDAQEILASQPEDPDGLFILGVVRLTMGQTDAALEVLDSVIVRYPQHLQAMVYRGLALAQSGDLEQATATWEIGLEMAGGSHPELEGLLQRAYAEADSAAAAPAGPPVTASAPMPPVAPVPPPAEAPSGPIYRAALELAPGQTPPPGAVLFVFLRPGKTGPPVAVKRISAPRFPLEVTLGAGDAMMGGELPDQGTLVARLDADGSASSRAPEDLEASSPAVVGERVHLVLGGS